MKNPIALNQTNLSRLPENVIVPTYDRSKVKTSIVHIGVGGFHRAHEAYYTDLLMENHGVTDCGICGIGLLKFDQKIYETLKAQDGLYTLMTKELDGSVSTRVIGSIVEFIFAQDEPVAVVEKMANPDIKIISLTITEGGYNFNDTTGGFDYDNEDVKWDMANLSQPKTVFGYLTQALKLRKDRGLQGCSIQSCDNIQGNGTMTRNMLCAFIEQVDTELLAWVKENVSFPNSMVDRITPVTTDADRAFLSEEYGVDGLWPVVCESFIQWVVEDDFVAGRPAWELEGVQFVKDVEPYENMKLGLLNAGHSVLGMLGALHGYDSIDEAASDTEFKAFLRGFMDEEVSPILPQLDGINLDEYKDCLLDRFNNIYIKDQISRICLESSAKMPKFLIPTLRSQLAVGGPIEKATLVLAAWCKYNKGVDEKGNTYEINDAMSDVLIAAANASDEDALAFLRLETVFGDLIENERFVSAYTSALETLNNSSVKCCVKSLI